MRVISSKLLALLAVVLLAQRATAGFTQCPSSLMKDVSDCTICPTGSTLKDVRAGKYPGVSKGLFVPHWSYSLNKVSTQLSTYLLVGIETCCDFCNKDPNCEYWSWTQLLKSDTSNSGE